MNTIIVLAAICLIVGLWLGWLWGYSDRPSAHSRPETLTADPREIVAVYEARREMDERMRDEGGGLNREAEKEIAAWEKEKAKKRKNRR